MDDLDGVPISLCEPLYCPVCAFGNYPMGRLGRRFHYNCRACGLHYSVEQPE